MKNKGFTLAEIMIVFTIIGIITAILLPMAFQSAPDENILKFKKGNSTLGTVIRELVSSDEYYYEGDLGKKAGDISLSDTGQISADSAKRYFCKTFGDLVSTNENNCSSAGVNHDGTVTASSTNLDSLCKTHQSTSPELITTDGIEWFFLVANTNFGSNTYSETNGNGFLTNYRLICFDVDGSGGEDPFGYGIRIDGKILNGARANEWLEKSVQKK